jgi:hypothetical protein
MIIVYNDGSYIYQFGRGIEQMEDTKVLTFNLEPIDISIVYQVANEMTHPNRSEALRQIIREWHFWSEQRRLAERPEAPVYPSGPAAVFAGHGRE